MGGLSRYHAVLAWLALILSPAVVLASSEESITARAWVNETSPYVKEAVIYTVRVYSTGNLRSVGLDPPEVAGASLEELDGPVTGVQTVDGQRYIINDFHFALTPMQAGRMRIGATRLNVSPAGDAPGWGGGYRSPWSRGSTSSEPLQVVSNEVTLSAHPPMVDGPKWLPLQSLTLKLHWPNGDQVEASEPLTLTVITKARGASGRQLPSVAGLLEGSDFKVYEDRPRVDWKLTGGGTMLWGRRVETFTLVPTREGALTIPSLSIPWWDVGTRQAQVASVPEHQVQVGAGFGSGLFGPRSAEDSGAGVFSSHLFTHFLLPVGGGLVVAFAFGWWLGGGRPATAGAAVPAGSAAVAAVGEEASPSEDRWWLERPLRGLRRARVGLVERTLTWRSRVGERLLGMVVWVLPRRAKAWWCTHCVASKEETNDLCQVVRRFACGTMQIEPNTPLQTIAQRITEDRPAKEARPLRKLFQDLDAAQYAGRAIDLAAWKRAFRRRFPKAFTRYTKARRPHYGLPQLNP